MTELDLYRTMARIRQFEEKAESLFMKGKLPGFVHLSIGQEAIAAGVCSQLGRSDYITSTHRGHGHAIAKGMTVEKMFLELFGREAGACHGKGGSMHIFDFEVGMLGANGVVAAGIPIATGAALAIRLANRDSVAVSFFGDGAANRGVFHESLNLAQVWELPVLFVVEQNGYASTTPYQATHAYESAARFASGYGMRSELVDGNDVEAVADAVRGLLPAVRSGEGPALLEAVTYRVKGHYVGDPGQYRGKEEIEAARERDPLARYRSVLTDRAIPAETLNAIDEEERERILRAAETAAEAALPEPEQALEHLFAESL